MNNRVFVFTRNFCVMKRLFFVLFIVGSLGALGQERFRTQPLSDQIKTLQVGVDTNRMTLPVIELNNSRVITIQFDEMSHNTKNYYYSVQHCNADWTPSSISDMEAIDGSSSGMITDYAASFNTTFLYTHYRITLPNADTRLKVSGNYRVKIYEDNDPDKTVAIACFSVVDPQVSINATVRGNTDIELNRRYQQVEFTIDNSNYSINDPLSELKVLVRQNNRTDNEAFGIQPTYTTKTQQSYVNNRDLIFEGGNEYRSFDCSSIYTFSGNIANIRFAAPYYHVTLANDGVRSGNPYEKIRDVNGRFVVHLQNDDNSDTDADYMLVHFSLPTDHPYFEGSLYLCGNLNYNLFNNASRMEYNAQHNAYEQTLLLKQGGYNYLYGFVKKGETMASLQPVEGSYWQAQNEYVIYVYHRAWGERYDRLIGVKHFSSN
jgi:hypothetical protein